MLSIGDIPGSPLPHTLNSDLLATGRVGRLCSLWLHGDEDRSFGREEVFLNTSLFPPGTVKVGALAAIVPIKSDVYVRDFPDDIQEASSDDAGKAKRRGGNHDKNNNKLTSEQRTFSKTQLRGKPDASIDWASQETNMARKFVFRVKEMGVEQKAKHPNLEVSLARHIAQALGFKSWEQVMVMTVEETLNTASHVELTFRGQYLARSDMWRLAISELRNKTLYRGQKILFMGTIRAQVKQIHVRGKKARSACFGADTRPVFRSESARYVLFIQMSSEMWEFDSNASGEIMFDTVTNGFLPELFKRWKKMNARHLVSIVLFARVRYEEPPKTSLGTDPSSNGAAGSRQRTTHRDFYRVVVSEMASGAWMAIISQLKREFKVFRREISSQKAPSRSRPTDRGGRLSREDDPPEAVVLGQPSSAMHGNILEAINLASSQFSTDYIDRDLARTGISIVIITPGTGIFEVDYNMLRNTTERLVSNGIGIDVVCLTEMPLHSVPLFKFRHPDRTSLRGSNIAYRSVSGETTPRQLHSAIGSYSSVGRGLSPSKSSVAGTSPRVSSAISVRILDEWCYAIPHWIDISFWAAPYEFRLQLDGQDGQDGQGQARRATRTSSFQPRVKMYELQMMGYLENQTSHISIPYLHQSPFYPPDPARLAHKSQERKEPRSRTSHMSLIADAPLFRPTEVLTSSFFARLDGSRPILEEDKETSRWMETYDENVFAPLEAVQAAERVAKSRKRTAKDPGRDADVLLFGTSVNEESTSPIRPYLHGVGSAYYFDRTMQERHVRQEKADKDAEKMMTAGIISKASRPSRLPSRHLSSGLPFWGLAAPKALASTEIRTEHARATQISHTSSGNHVFPSDNRSIGAASSRRLSLRRVDRSSIRSEADSESKDDTVITPLSLSAADSPSRPIAIKGPGILKESKKMVAKHRTSIVKASPFDASSHDVRQSERIDVLHAVSTSKSKQAGPKFDGSGSVPRLLTTLSPTSALAPWLTLVNPSNPRKYNTEIEDDFGRWQHVYPRPIRTSAMKWKSLCSPASVPLTTEIFPTAEQLALEYQENPYNISQNEDDELSELPRTRDDLMKELIGLRLAQGFQIVVGPAVREALGAISTRLVNLFDSEHIGEDGAIVVMSLGNTIHQLQCIDGGEVEVKRYVRKSTSSSSSVDPYLTGADRVDHYEPSIRTILADSYEPRVIIFPSTREDQNWNYVDGFLAGYEEQYTEHLRFWRARYVLIPIDQTFGVRGQLPISSEDNEEEHRLEGIRKLTQMWQRYRLSSDDSSPASKRRVIKDPNPLDIVYQTRDPSAVIAAELDNLPLLDTDSTSGNPRSRLFMDTEPFARSNYKLPSLAQDIQGEKGITMQDRRWHFRFHYNCFVGTEMTTWLLENFRDVSTREEAVEFGNELMTAGLFKHVESRHQFRDGNYFYQIASEYRTIRPESRRGWFGGGGGSISGATPTGGSIRRLERSMPSTPLTGPIGGSPRADPSQRISSDETLAAGLIDPPSVTTTPEPPLPRGDRKLKVALSKSMRYDVDRHKRSYRPEIINLHYDRLHNPDNCYHIRIDWMNVTAKLIEDAILTWATTAAQFGLRLVEVPINEACSITQMHPFRSPYAIQLALQPPSSPSSSHIKADDGAFSPRLPSAVWSPTQRHPYHHALLRKFNFVLDIEAASNFPTDIVDVTYSWGKPSYRYTQYIHRSGTILAQITDDGNLLLLANRLCNDRVTSRNSQPDIREPHTADRRGTVDITANSSTSTPPIATTTTTTTGPTTTTMPPHPTSTTNPPTITPFASPLIRAYIDPSDDAAAAVANNDDEPSAESLVGRLGKTPVKVKNEIEAFCHDKLALARFYDDLIGTGGRSSANASPGRAAFGSVSAAGGTAHAAGGIAVKEGNIPVLGLPPSLREITAQQLGRDEG